MNVSQLALGSALGLDADDTYIYGGEHYATVIWRLQPDVIVMRNRRAVALW